MIGNWWGPSSFSMPTSDIACSNRINLQSEECKKDLRKVYTEFTTLKNHLNKLLKIEGNLYDEILKERKEGINYLVKHNLKTNYIFHTTSEFHVKLEKILNNYGLPLEATKEQLANEWKAQNRLTDSVKSLKKELCALQSKISSVSERDKHRTEIDRLKQDLGKEEQSIEKLYSNTIEPHGADKGLCTIANMDMRPSLFQSKAYWRTF